MKLYNFIFLAIASMTTFLPEANAQFQRMRISSGTYEILGKSAQAVMQGGQMVGGAIQLGGGVGQIAAACIDFGRSAPSIDDIFQFGSDAIRVIRKKNNIEEEATLNEALQAGWLRIRGNNSYSSVDIEALDADYLSLHVPEDELGIIGSSSNEVAEAVENISSKTDLLSQLRTSRLELQSQTDDPQLLGLFDTAQQHIEWVLQESGREEVAEMIEQLSEKTSQLVSMQMSSKMHRSRIIEQTGYDEEQLIFFDNYNNDIMEASWMGYEDFFRGSGAAQQIL